MEANNTLAGDLFGEMVMEQAIADKTAAVEAEMQAAQQAQVEAYGLGNEQDRRAEERAGSEEDEDPDFAMDEEEERMLRQMAEDRIAAARAEH